MKKPKDSEQLEMNKIQKEGRKLKRKKRRFRKSVLFGILIIIIAFILSFFLGYQYGGGGKGETDGSSQSNLIDTIFNNDNNNNTPSDSDTTTKVNLASEDIPTIVVEGTTIYYMDNPITLEELKTQLEADNITEATLIDRSAIYATFSDVEGILQEKAITYTLSK